MLGTARSLLMICSLRFYIAANSCKFAILLLLLVLWPHLEKIQQHCIWRSTILVILHILQYSVNLELQFLKMPLETGFKSKSIPMDPHIKMLQLHSRNDMYTPALLGDGAISWQLYFPAPKETQCEAQCQVQTCLIEQFLK